MLHSLKFTCFFIYCMFKHFSHFSLIDITPMAHCVCYLWNSLEQVGGEWVCSRWLCVGCVWVLCGCEKREFNVCCFKKHSFVSWRYIGIFVIYDCNYNINISKYSKLSLSPLSPWRYQLGFSSKSFNAHHLSQHVSSTAHCQVGDKNEFMREIILFLWQ
jgi:hypothetical protein